MKESKWLCILAGVIIAVFLIRTANECYWFSQYEFQCDIKLRANEVRCAHTGINPFRVWNRDVESDLFVPLTRPDKPDIRNKNGLLIHAYPAWHNTFFWIYGYVPLQYIPSLFFAFNVLCLIGLVLAVAYAFRNCTRLFGSWLVVFLLVLLLHPVLFCAYVGNYGILLAFLSLVLYYMLDRGKDTSAGAVYALMMIKPQVGLLFVWPLLIGRKFKTICVAVLLCLFATIVQAYVCQENVVDLVLQVPEIGRPYSQGRGLWVRFFEMLVGKAHGGTVLAVFGFLLCGALCYYVKDAKRWWMKTIPVSMVFPVWTFSQEYDLIVTWNLILFCVVLYCNVETDRLSDIVKRFLKIGFIVYIVTVVVESSWVSATICNMFKPIGNGWMYHMLVTGPRFVYWVVLYALICQMLHEKVRFDGMTTRR